MGWLAIIGLVFQYGPQLIEAIGALITAIRSKNLTAGKAAITQASDLASKIVISLQSRSNMTNEAKREQAVSDLLMGAKMTGITLSESEARTLVELALQQAKAKGV